MKNSSRLLAAMPKNLARSSSGCPSLACSSTRSLKESQLRSRSKYSDGSRKSGSVDASAIVAATRLGRRADVGLIATPICHISAKSGWFRTPDERAGEFPRRFRRHPFVYAPCLDADIFKAGNAEHIRVVRLGEGSSDAAHPRPHVPTEGGGELTPYNHVRNGEPATGLEDAKCLLQDLTFVGRQVDHAIRDYDIHRVRREWDGLDIAFEEFHVCDSRLALIVTRQLEH